MDDLLFNGEMGSTPIGQYLALILPASMLYFLTL